MQGFNMGRYVAPEHEGVLTFNQSSGKSRVRHRQQTTVRFEMPFAVWCSSCAKPTLIGQGVRFNAVKAKVGNYHSTPIWSFVMKHAVCGGGEIEIRTDPENTAYVCFRGCRARDYGSGLTTATHGRMDVDDGDQGTGTGSGIVTTGTNDDRTRVGTDGIEILDPVERDRRREDAFAVLEGRKRDEGETKVCKKRIEELGEISEKFGRDPYAVNRALRRSFRTARHERKRKAVRDEAIKERLGIGFELVDDDDDDDAQEADSVRASAVEFAAVGGSEDVVRAAGARPLFGGTRSRGSASEARGSPRDRRSMLQDALRDSSRAELDPFGRAKGAGRSTAVKRKALDDSSHDRPLEKMMATDVERSVETPVASRLGLVEYDSE